MMRATAALPRAPEVTMSGTLPSFAPRGALLVAAGGLVSLTLACGGGTAPTAGQPPERAPVATPVTTPAAPPAPAHAGEGGRDGVRRRGVLRVAADPDAAPFLAKGTDGNWEGYEYAIVRALADRAGVPAEIVGASFPNLTEKVTSGAADLAIGQISPSATYGDLAWSVSYLQYSLCLVVPAKSAIKSVSDLKGKRVAMYDDVVARQVTDVLVSASYERVLFDDYGYFEKMVRGQLDAMVYDCPLARHEITTYGDKLRIAEDALNVATYNVAVPSWDTALLADVNTVLKELGDQGLLATLEQRWLGASAPAESYTSATGKIVVVKRGETLSLIAKRELGETDRWKALYESNKDVVGPDPNQIYTGMRLRLPAAQGAQGSAP
ncbi:MAG: transporter substrate-binding domain-containing protein [Pseudomonadota bacterium]|nr:transporter substrate-binding domain-containing protein [Pseudomonadota bacterium]